MHLKFPQDVKCQVVLQHLNSDGTSSSSFRINLEKENWGQSQGCGGRVNKAAGVVLSDLPLLWAQNWTTFPSLLQGCMVEFWPVEVDRNDVHHFQVWCKKSQHLPLHSLSSHSISWVPMHRVSFETTSQISQALFSWGPGLAKENRSWSPALSPMGIVVNHK